MSGSWGSWEMGLFAACYLLYGMRVSCFLKKRLKGKPAQAWIFGGLLFCACMVRRLWLEDAAVPYILSAALSHVLLVILVAAVFEGEREKRVFAAAVVAAMTELIWNFSEAVLVCGGLLFFRFTGKKEEIDGLILMVLTYGAGIMAVNGLSKPLTPIFEDKRKSWYLCGSFVLGAMVFITDLVNWAASNGIMVHDWGVLGVYENQLFSNMALCLFFGLSMAATGLFVFGMDRIDRQERDGEQYRAKVAYYEMMEDQYGRMERLRHDMKNHMLALENLVRNRRWEEACGYLREMTETGSVETGDEVTGSLVLDALLYHKKRQAMEQGILWQCDVRAPSDCPVKEMDLCVIVGNILDNALEACARLAGKEDLFIRISMGQVKQCLLLEAENSADISAAPPMGVSTKEDGLGHGLGLGNVRAAAAGYNGAVHEEAKEGVFTISVLVPLYREN